MSSHGGQGAYGLGAPCAPCVNVQSGAGLGTIIMQPLRGGLGTTHTTTRDDMVMRFGAAGPLALMGGAALHCGAISGIAARSWAKGATGALLGAGVTGVLAGGTVAIGGQVAAAAQTDAGILPPEEYENQRTGYLTAGLPAVGVGLALLVWGGWRVWKKK